MKNRIIVAVIFLPLLIITILFLPPFVFCYVITFICIVSAYEILTAAGTAKENRFFLICAVLAAGAIPVWAHFFGSDTLFLMAALLVLMCFVFIIAALTYKTGKNITFTQILTAFFGGILIPFLLSSLINMRNMQEGRLIVLLPVISAFITDAGAYFTGVFLGRHKAFPNISPKKTVEGYIGGLITGAAFIVLYGLVLDITTTFEIKYWALIIYGIVGAVVTELGDLAFSLIKRELDVKDYGRLFPGHGGMLDRFDSMVFAAPVMYLLVLAFPAVIV